MKSSYPKRIVLIGTGIMSATLGILLKKLIPNCQIQVLERLDTVGSESSEAMNNAGTGHSAFCELNYTPELPDGTIDTHKAIKIAASFELSKQLWSYLVQHNELPDPLHFIHQIPHHSFVWGQENVEYLRKRYSKLQESPFFEGMIYSESRDVLAEWMPLIMKGRNSAAPLAATKMGIGTDVNFGALTRFMFNELELHDDTEIYLRHEVVDFEKQPNGTWLVVANDLENNVENTFVADFVFIGAGGGAIKLLEKSNIAEAEGYGGFPISGQWLVCNNPELTDLHHAKVYGKAEVGSPPMSVPHLDTRFIHGKKALLFGPFAGFLTKFLKNGSYWDLPLSLEMDNIVPMIAAGWHNIPLTKYLIEQVSQSPEERLNALRNYFPEAKLQDWDLEIAGQRVQIIKKDKEKGGVLEFGTEIVAAADGTIAALLGASPGASTAVTAMLEVLRKCFPDLMDSETWQRQLREMMPGLAHDADDRAAIQSNRLQSRQILFPADHENFNSI